MCDFNTKVAEDLRKHIRNKHSINIFHGVDIQTDGIKEIENTKQADDDKILPRVHIVEVIDMVDEIACDKCEFQSNSKEDIRKHIESHNQPLQPSLEPTSFDCELCEFCSTNKET